MEVCPFNIEGRCDLLLGLVSADNDSVAYRVGLL